METTRKTHSPTSLDPATHLGVVTLAVAAADRALVYYRDLLGLRALETTDESIMLGVDTPLLKLIIQPGARPKRDRETGLYHVAILLPTRVALAQVLQRLIDHRIPLGQADHLVSEALYLTDPDGNGLEIYRDRPRSEWVWHQGQVRMATLPLKIEEILGEMQTAPQPWRGMPAGTTIGHIHLQVGDIATAKAFYSDKLGFDVVAQMPGALFLSAGGYHHHIGLNTWQSRGGPPAPPEAAGLRSYVIQVPSADALAAVKGRLDTAGIVTQPQDGALVLADPWQNIIHLRIA